MARKTLKYTLIRNAIQSEEKEISFTSITIDKVKNHIFIEGVPTNKKNTTRTYSIPFKYGEITIHERWNKEVPLRSKDDKSK